MIAKEKFFGIVYIPNIKKFKKTFVLIMWWIRSDCCGVFCALFTICLIFFAAVVQVYYVLGPWKGYMSPHVMLYLTMALAASVSHTKCQFSNPGSVPLEAIDDNTLTELEVLDKSRLKWCKHCKRYKPTSAHHCSSCERCIVNNCVAMFNQKYFLQFLLYTGSQCLFCLVSLASRFFTCSTMSVSVAERYAAKRNLVPSFVMFFFFQKKKGEKRQHLFFKKILFVKKKFYCSADIVCCILNFIEAILFGLFSSEIANKYMKKKKGYTFVLFIYLFFFLFYFNGLFCKLHGLWFCLMLAFVMLYDQLCAIFANTPYIDSLKGRRGSKKNRYECMKDVMGEAFGIRCSKYIFCVFISLGIVKDNFESIIAKLIND
ncbi:hypothetical protein RFI_23851 [Reticulomyxa filosa]|uniref:Palmitoyltransferase n=1 Tax=Reticulomyxa filosa TaxID=46433 RepID=X6MJA5_RETFI|nr:hypothetical protein RFI_23851 [Reticulomyxa filosa]|eukprot:ETO13517.1 hypothetical protein RFI_23851 [Reticulomyxa filosa]